MEQPPSPAHPGAGCAGRDGVTVDAVLVELEGVIFDTAGPRRAALERALREEGVGFDDVAWDDACAGLPVATALAALARRGLPLDETARELARLRAERHFADTLGGPVLMMPGARAAFERLAAMTRVTVLTRATRREAARMLEIAELEPLVETIITSDDGALKPDPRAWREALARLSRRRPVPVARVVALEDDAPGIRGARTAGLRCIAVGRAAPHRVLEANAWLPTLEGVTAERIARLAAGGDAGVR